MHINQKGIEFIKQKEGVKLSAYPDVGNKMTIGIGHLIKPDEKIPNEITMEKAEQLLRDDLTIVENAINKYVKVDLDQEQFNSLCSLVFNIGINAFINSTLLKLLNKNEILKTADEFLKWSHVNGKVSPGLLVRRKDEAALFLS